MLAGILGSCSVSGVEPKPDELHQAPFTHFQSLDKQRKRRMSWIPKTGGGSDGHLSQELAGFPNVPQVDKIEEELPGPVVAHLTREEKSKAKKEAEDYQEAGMSFGIFWHLLFGTVELRPYCSCFHVQSQI